MNKSTGTRILETAGITILAYIEDGYKGIPAIRLSNEEYGRGLQRFINVCADVLPINSEWRKIYLGLRKTEPMRYWWYIGGKILPGVENPAEAAARTFKLEANLEISPSHLVHRAIINYLWKTRQERPQNIGKHDESWLYSYEISPEELKQVRLNPKWFEDENLYGFNREDLIKAEIFPSLVDVYDIIFPANT